MILNKSGNIDPQSLYFSGKDNIGSPPDQAVGQMGALQRIVKIFGMP